MRIPFTPVGRASAVGAIAAAAVAVTAVSPAVASSWTSPAPRVTAGSTYLALGDSVPFGFQEPAVTPAPDYSNPVSFVGYPEQLGSELHLRVVNAACPGETSASLINATAQSNGCENTVSGSGQGYRVLHPLHVGYTGSQLAFALSFLRHHPDTRLVSLMVGANDLFVCQKTTKDGCAAELPTALGHVAANVKTIVSSIRNKAHYRGQLVVQNYYSLDYADPTQTVPVQLLNGAVDRAAAPFHVAVTDAFALLGTAAAHSGGNACTAGLLTQLTGAGTPCGVHPSFAGQALLAQAVVTKVRL